MFLRIKQFKKISVWSIYKQKTMDYLKARYIGVKGLDGTLDDEAGRFLLLVPALYVDEKYLAYCCPLSPHIYTNPISYLRKYQFNNLQNPF
jgi:hypothetical protein